MFFLEREERKEKERERNIHVWLPLACPLLRTWPATQACALTGNRTSDPLVRRPVLNPLSHTSQGCNVYILKSLIDSLCLSLSRISNLMLCGLWRITTYPNLVSVMNFLICFLWFLVCGSWFQIPHLSFPLVHDNHQHTFTSEMSTFKQFTFKSVAPNTMPGK